MAEMNSTNLNQTKNPDEEDSQFNRLYDEVFGITDKQTELEPIQKEESQFDRLYNEVFTPQEPVEEPTQKTIAEGFEEELSLDKWKNSFKQSIASPLQGIKETADVFGYKRTAKTLESITPEVDENFESAGYRFMNPKEEDYSILGFSPQYFPRALVEQAGQLAGSIATSVAGAAIGTSLGTRLGPKGAAVGGAIGRYGGPFLFEAIQIAGPTIRERAKNNDREEPTWDDITGGLATAAGSGALNALAQKFLPGGDAAVEPLIKRLITSGAAEGGTEGLQALLQQAGGTAFTEAGLKLEPKQAIGEGLIGAGAGTTATAVEAGATSIAKRVKGKEEIQTEEDVEATKPTISVPATTGPLAIREGETQEQYQERIDNLTLEEKQTFERQLPSPVIEEEKKGRVQVAIPAAVRAEEEAQLAAKRKEEASKLFVKPESITPTLEVMEREAVREDQRKDKIITGTEVDATKSATERLKNKRAELEQKNIPSQALKVVENQIDQAKPSAIPAVKTADDILAEKREFFDRQDIEPITIDDTELSNLKKVADNTADDSIIGDLKNKGYIYEVEDQVVITEPARRAMGPDAPPSERDRLKEIRDQFEVSDRQLNETSNQQLISGIKVTNSVIPRLEGIKRERAEASRARMQEELLRRSQTPVESKAGPRFVIDQMALTGIGNILDATTFVANKIDTARQARKDVRMNYVNPETGKSLQVTGFNKGQRKIQVYDESTDANQEIPMGDLVSGKGYLEVFSKAESRSRKGEEINEPITRQYDPIPTQAREGEVEIADVESTPLTEEGFTESKGNENEAGRKKRILDQADATNGGNFLSNMVKKGGTKGKIAGLVLKAGFGNANIRVGRFGITSDEGKRFAGLYRPDTNEILINLDESDSYTDQDGNHDVESTLLHELGHAAFVNKLANKEALDPAESKALRDLTDIYNNFNKKYKDANLTGNTKNALNNLFEFASEIIVNPDVQSLVRDIQPEQGLLQKALQYILNFVQGKEINPYNEVSRAWQALNTLADKPRVLPRTETEAKASTPFAVSMESMPGASTKVLGWLHTSSPEVRREFHNAFLKAMTNTRTGENLIIKAMKDMGLIDYDVDLSDPKVSTYINDALIQEYNLTTSVSGFKTKADAELFGLIYGKYALQEAISGYAGTSNGLMDGFSFDYGRPLSKKEWQDVLRTIRQTLSNAGLENAETLTKDVFAPYPTENGYDLVSLGFDPTITTDILNDIVDNLSELNARVNPESKSVVEFKADTLFKSNDWKKQKKGEKYEREIRNTIKQKEGITESESRTRSSDLLKRLDSSLAPRLRKLYDGYSARADKETKAKVKPREFRSPALTDTAEDIKSRTIAGTPVGTRSPTAVKATESGVDPNSVIDLKAARKDPRTYKRNALLLTQYSHIAKEFPELSNRFKEISKPLTDIESAIEQDKTRLNTLKENLKVALAKEKGIVKSKIKGKDIENVIAQENKKTSETLRPIVNEIKDLESRIAANKAEKKGISAVVNKQLDGYVMAADIPIELADKIYETMVGVAKSNLRTLFDLFPADLVKIAKLWYDGANILAQEFAGRFNTNLNRASAVLAVFSPQKDWFMNISLAERAMEIWNTQQDTEWDAEMSKQYLKRAGDPEEIISDDGTITYEKGAQPIIDDNGEIIGWKNWKDEQAAAKREEAVLELKKMEGKKLKDLPPKHQSRFIRMYAETKFPSSYNMYSPNGTKLGFAKTDKGADKKVAWGGYNTIDKAIAILSASPENEMQVISDSLGEQHKVRSFYNNIVDPQNKSGAVTMDTHAIAALTLMPLSGASREVTQNFGGGGTTKSSIVGANGLYAAFAEAYRQLAPELSKDFGIDYLPREIQSVTWEAIRMLFPAKWKSNKTNVQGVRDIWKQYEQGTKSIEQVRNAIFELAKGKSIARASAEAKANGEGLGRPDWATDTEFGIDNLGRQRKADDTGRLPEGGRDTDGAGRPARGRRGTEPTTAVVSGLTEGGESGAVLTEFRSPASPSESKQFPNSPKKAYTQALWPRGTRWLFGKLTKDIRRAREKFKGKKEVLKFRMDTIPVRMKKAAERDGVSWSSISQTASKAYAKSPDGPSIDQLEQASIKATDASNEKLVKYVSRKLTKKESNDVKRVQSSEKVSYLEALSTVVDPEKFQQILDYSRTQFKREKNVQLLEINKANRERAIKEAQDSLNSLPPNLKRVVLEVRNEIESYTNGAIKDGVIGSDAKIVLSVNPEGEVIFTLPKELQKSSPRYGRATIEFASDLDKVAYILANDAVKQSKGAEKFRKAIESVGLKLNDVIAHGVKVKEALKDLAGGKTPTKETELSLSTQEFTGAVPKVTKTTAETDTKPQLTKPVSKLKVEEIYWASLDKDFLDSLKLDRDTINKLVQFIQNVYKSNRADQILEEVGQPVDPRIAEILGIDVEDGIAKTYSRSQAEQVAISEKDETFFKNLITRFLNDIKTPNKAFENLAKDLLMTEDQVLSGIPKILKDALKPLDDAGLKYVELMAQIGNSMMNRNMFEDMRNQLLNMGWAYDPATWDVDTQGAPPADFKTLEEFSEKEKSLIRMIPGFMSTFSKLKVDPIFVEGVIDEMAPTDVNMSGVNKALNVGNVIAQLGLTAYDVIRGTVRQFLGGPLFLIHNGHIISSPQVYKESFLTALAAFKKDSKDPERLAYVEEAISLNLIDQNIDIRRIEDAAKGWGNQDINTLNGIDKILYRPTKEFTKWLTDFAKRTFTFPDNFFRLVAWEAEKIIVRKAFPNMSEKEISTLAADRAKESMPTYDRMLRLGEKLRRPGYQNAIGAFIGFGAETARVTGSNGMLAKQDMMSGNPTLKLAGIRRTLGIATAYAGLPILSLIISRLNDISDDEEDSLRRGLKFAKNEDLVIWRNEKTGELEYVSMSFINAFSGFTSGLYRALRNGFNMDETEDWHLRVLNSIASGFAESFGGYLDLNIFTSQLFDTLSNKDGRVWYPSDSNIVKFGKGIWNISQVLIPASLRRLPELYDTLTDDKQAKTSALLNNLAIKSRSYNPEKGLNYQLREASAKIYGEGGKGGINSIFRETALADDVTEEEFRAAYKDANDRLYKQLYNASVSYKDSLVLGVSVEKSDDIVDDVNFNKEMKEGIRTGIIPKFNASESTLNLIDKKYPERIEWYNKIYDEEMESFNLYRDSMML
jgi:hypothetical protein